MPCTGALALVILILFNCMYLNNSGIYCDIVANMFYDKLWLSFVLWRFDIFVKTVCYMCLIDFFPPLNVAVQAS